MNEALQTLYAEDLRDAQTLRGEEAFVASQARRVRVAALIDAGGLEDAEDYFHAALIFQHGEALAHWAQAHLLAHTAADLGHSQASYMIAASHDRWLMRQGKPQKYGTNSIFDGERSRIWDYDPRTTDAERAALNVPPLAQLIERGRALNDLPSEDQLVTLVTFQGLAITISDVGAAGPPPDMPIYGIPQYVALPLDHQPQPDRLPPELSLWQFGKLICAKDQAGTVVCAWHRCEWRITTPAAPITAAQLWESLGPAAQWLSAADAYWSRLIMPTSATDCWIVGGHLPRAELEALATSLATV